MSLWDDHAAHSECLERCMHVSLLLSVTSDCLLHCLASHWPVLWLDSSYPVGKSGPGVLRGPCGTDTGVPSQVEAQHPDAYVRYSDIRFGEIGTTL